MRHKEALTCKKVASVVCTLLLIGRSISLASLVQAEDSSKSIRHPQESSIAEQSIVHKTQQQARTDQDAAQLARATEKLTTMLSAATTIQETLQSAFQQQAELVKDLTVLRNDLTLISQGHDGTVTDDSKIGLYEGGPSIPDSCMAKGSVSNGDMAWASGFEQLAVQVLGSRVTALHAMHPSRLGGLALFAVAGTADGLLHFLDAQGNAVARHDTGELQSVSAIASHRLSRNESLVAVGFADGSVITLKVHSSVKRAHRNAAEQGTVISIAIERQLMDDKKESEVSHLVFLAPPRQPHQLVVAKRSGHVDVWRQDGTLRLGFQVKDPVKLLNLTPKGALVVTAQGITSVVVPKDQPSSSAGSVLRPELVETRCQGLDGSIIFSAAWAVSDHGAPQYDRVYALTEEGHLLVMFVTQLGASQRCKVMYRTALHNSPMTASIEAIRGYVLLTTPNHIHVFKVNSTGLHEINTDHWVNLFPVEPAAEERASAPCLATSRYNLVLLDLGKGRLGMFKSKLPFREPVNLQRDSWKRPLFAIAMAVVGCYQFARLKGRRKLAGAQQDLVGLPNPGARIERDQGLQEDEDAEFAAEIRAVLREERRRSGNGRCSGREASVSLAGEAGVGPLYRGGHHPRDREYAQPDRSEEQRHGSAADEDAEFAAEIRAALREEQLRGRALSSSGLEGGLGSVIYEGFGGSDGAYGEDRVGRPPEIGGPLWADQGRLLLRRKGAGVVYQKHQEQSEGTEMDLQDNDIGPGFDNSAGAAALHAKALRVRIDELCAGNKRSSR